MVDAWARVRVAGVARGQRLGARLASSTVPLVHEVGGEDATEIDVDVSFDWDG